MSKKRKVQITLAIIGFCLILLITLIYFMLFQNKEQIEIAQEDKITDECIEERIMDG